MAAAAAAASSASLHPATADLPPPPPPLHTTAPRPRRRAREVSSRYLSTPVPSSPRLSTSSSPAASLTPSPHARTRVATPFANENHPPVAPALSTTVSRRRAIQRLFGETGANTNPRASVSSSTTSCATPQFLPRLSSGQSPSTARRGYPRPPTPAHASSCPSDAGDDAVSSCSTETSSTLTDFYETDGIAVAAAPCESPPLLGPSSCRGGRLSSELRGSVPESGGFTRAATPLCNRSLNSALSSWQAPAGKLMVAPRPPQPQGTKVAELKKAAIIGGRKIIGKQEDVHQLRLLDNRYVQYRFLNARAELAAKAKTAVAENSLFGLVDRIDGLRKSVAEKRADEEKIKRDQRLFCIVADQVPYLDQWSDVEEDYSSCLTGATSALHNASLLIPVNGNVLANCEEISEVLNSAVQLLEPVSPCVGKLLPKVEDIDGVASNLAHVIASERSLIEECGNLLYQAHHMQMRECSLRSQLLQLKS